MHAFRRLRSLQTVCTLVGLPVVLALGCNGSNASTGGTGGGTGSFGGGTSSGGVESFGGSASSGGVESFSGGATTSGRQNSGGTIGTIGSSGDGGQTASSSGLGTKASGGTTSTSASGTKATGGTTSTSSGGTKVTGGTTSTGSGGTKAIGGSPTSSTAIGTPHTGEITFYDDNGNGTCMFGVTGETDVAALAIGSWSTAAWCGACADVTGPKGTVRVKVVNQCPTCGGAWDLDLNKSAFLKIQEEKVGRFSVSWNFVPCGTTGAVKYKFKEGSSAGWTAVLVSDTNLPVTTLEWSTDQTTWHATQRQDYNYFQDASGFGRNPVYVRITAVGGQQLIDQLPTVQASLVVTGKANFN